MKKISIVISLAVAALFAASCEFVEPEWVTPIALGAKTPIVVLPDASAGDSQFQIVSDCEYDLRFINGSEWVTITEKAERTVGFTYTANNGIKRNAKIEISAPGRKDTLTVRQPGIYDEYITIPSDQKTFSVPAAGAIYRVDFATNILTENILFEAGSTQIGNVQISKNSVFFEVLPAKSRDPKTFTLTVYALDGWDQKIEAVITLNQAKAS